MQDQNLSIHDFDLQLICSYYSHLERQGPGSPEVTLKALSFTDHLSSDSRIADIGCGTGTQTMTLARHTTGHITGIDLFPDFINQLNAKASEENLQNRVTAVVGNMENLPFTNEELDLIWSEGAIYNIGFERGLNEWRKFIKTGGYIAVSEVSWLTLNPPDEIKTFWQDAYPGIDSISNKVAQMEQAGYMPVATFILPENCWTKHFYTPQVPLQKKFLAKYPGNKSVKTFVDNQRNEAQLYHKYKDFYGYVFYIGKKI